MAKASQQDGRRAGAKTVSSKCRIANAPTLADGMSRGRSDTVDVYMRSTPSLVIGVTGFGHLEIKPLEVCFRCLDKSNGGQGQGVLRKYNAIGVKNAFPEQSGTYGLTPPMRAELYCERCKFVTMYDPLKRIVISHPDPSKGVKS